MEEDDSFRPTDEELLREFFKKNDKYFIEDLENSVFKVGSSFIQKATNIEVGEL